MIEAEVLKKIRATLIGDATVQGYVSTRVYAEHISAVSSPVFPAISMMLFPGQARTEVPDMVNFVFQLDLWFPVNTHTIDQVLACYGRIRTLLHRQVFDDANVKIKLLTETAIGPVMYDETIDCRHLPVRYAGVAI